MPVNLPPSDTVLVEFQFGKWRILDSIIPDDVRNKAMEKFRENLPQKGNFVQSQRNFGTSHEVTSIAPSEKGHYNVTIKILTESAGGAMLKRLLENGHSIHAVEMLGDMKKEGRTVTELIVKSIDVVES
jgi:hypothetical protein